MKRRTIVVALPIILLALIFTIVHNVGVSNSQPDSDKTNDAQEPDERIEYMTEEEIVVMFYINFDTFDRVAEYALNTEGVFYCGGNLNEIVLGNGSDLLSVEDVEIGEQIKMILSLGFIRFEENETETNIFFHIPHVMGTQGVLYTKVEPWDKTIPQLDKEDWYYFFLRND